MRPRLFEIKSSSLSRLAANIAGGMDSIGGMDIGSNFRVGVDVGVCIGVGVRIGGIITASTTVAFSRKHIRALSFANVPMPKILSSVCNNPRNPPFDGH